ncbi:MAG: YihY/virulence factor BrkB family protein [Bryobacteraceae bacterium]
MKGFLRDAYLSHMAKGARVLIPRISLDVCKEAFTHWLDHRASRLGAALAFYSLLSLAPLLLFVVAIVALVFGRQEAQSWILQQVRQLVGPQGATTVYTLLRDAHHSSSGFTAGFIGILTLLFGASGVFSELRDGLDTVWECCPGTGSGWKGLATSRLFAFGMVLSIGFLLLVSLIVSTTLAALLRYFSQVIPVPGTVLVAINFVAAIYMIAFLFALIFKYVPHAHVDWAEAWNGALFTAILFTFGKMLLGEYLGVASVGSAYGAAGSVVAVVVWVYYSAQIFYYGAEFIWVHSKRHREHRTDSSVNRPSPNLANAAGA